MEKLWTRASDMAGAPSVMGQAVGRAWSDQLGHETGLRSLLRGGPGGRSNSSQVHQANASAAALSAVEIHVSLVGQKDLPARSTAAAPAEDGRRRRPPASPALRRASPHSLGSGAPGLQRNRS